MKKELVKNALRAQYFLIGYNILEALASLFFGGLAGSIALVGFGLESVVESASTIIVALRLRENGKISPHQERGSEMAAWKAVGYSFFLLAAYVGYESMKKLFFRQMPEASLPGVAIASISLVLMPTLAKHRHELGHQINSNSLVADSKQTMLCAYMSAALLAGIGLNYFFGFWWADPVVGLIIAAVALKEGKDALAGKTCC